MAILDRLAAWDAGMRADQAEPLIFTAWVRETVRAVYQDDLGTAFSRYFDTRAQALARLLEGRAKSRDWCDDRRTPARETCDAIIARALGDALADLARRYGADAARWRWGPAHFARNEHQALGPIPGLGWLFNIDVPSPGGSYTLDRGKTEFAEEPPYANRMGTSLRAIYDFADLERSLFMHATGQSGNPFSPFYRSLAERWARVEYFEIPTQREAVAKAAIGTWVLTPR
jgi:penicillin amidase